MKQWPQDGSPVSIKEIVEPLVAAFADCYHCILKPDAGPFQYRGYNFGDAEAAAGVSPHISLNNPADPLYAILEAGVMLGAEQGRRSLREKTLSGHFNQKTKKTPTAAPGAWPDDDKKAVYFSALTRPLIKALHHFYRLRRGRRSVDVDFKGYDIGDSLKVCCLSPDALLTAESLRYDKQEQGRSAYEVIIGLAVQIGMEQGERLLQCDPAYIEQIQYQEIEAKHAEQKWAALTDDDKRRVLKDLKSLLDGDKL